MFSKILVSKWGRYSIKEVVIYQDLFDRHILGHMITHERFKAFQPNRELDITFPKEIKKDLNKFLMPLGWKYDNGYFKSI